MNPTINLNFVSQAIDQMAMRGRMPAEIHMSGDTHKHFVAALLQYGLAVPEKPLTRWQKIRNWVTRRSPAVVVWRFRNIPLVVSSFVPDGGIVIRPLHLMAAPNWLEICLEEQRVEAQRMEARMNQQRAVHAPETAGAFFPENGVSVTDLLVKAVENCDDVKHAIVIKVRPNQKIEIATNADRFTLYGILTGCVGRVAQGE